MRMEAVDLAIGSNSAFRNLRVFFIILHCCFRPRCTNDDQAWTMLKFDPDLSSVTIFCCINAVQRWTRVELGLTLNRRLSSDQILSRVQLCSHMRTSQKIVSIECSIIPAASLLSHYQNKRSFDNKINFWKYRTCISISCKITALTTDAKSLKCAYKITKSEQLWGIEVIHLFTRCRVAQVL